VRTVGLKHPEDVEGAFRAGWNAALDLIPVFLEDLAVDREEALEAFLSESD
jgi:hypothetical protein